LDSLIHLEIVTPRKIDFSGDVKSFTAPGIEGSFQILPRHAAFITTLQIGKVKFITNDGQEKIYATSGGVVEVHENKISMLAETIESKEDIDIALNYFEKAKEILLDDVIGFKCSGNKEFSRFSWKKRKMKGEGSPY
jgi:F-type H+-transporting ATPase subunit epsilon